MNSFETKLSGGHPNSLGNTEAVVAEVLADKSQLETLYQCYFSDDEVVRLRTSSAFKRVAQQEPEWLLAYIDRFLTEVAAIDQASTQWTLAKLFEMLEKRMTPQQRSAAEAVMKRNLVENEDWIVLINTMQVLFQWSRDDKELRTWLVPHLKRLTKDSRKSVAARATKLFHKA